MGQADTRGAELYHSERGVFREGNPGCPAKPLGGFSRDGNTIREAALAGAKLVGKELAKEAQDDAMEDLVAFMYDTAKHYRAQFISSILGPIMRAGIQNNGVEVTAGIEGADGQRMVFKIITGVDPELGEPGEHEPDEERD